MLKTYPTTCHSTIRRAWPGCSRAETHFFAEDEKFFVKCQNSSTPCSMTAYETSHFNPVNNESKSPLPSGVAFGFIEQIPLFTCGLKVLFNYLSSSTNTIIPDRTIARRIGAENLRTDLANHLRTSPAFFFHPTDETTRPVR